VNKENAKDYLPLVQALADGKVIQKSDSYGDWFDVDHPAFDVDPVRYRIKPDPREIWVNRFPDGHEGYSWYETEEGAHRAYGRVGAVQVRYREVIE
jgi:hypothetical protein